ncbi:MAG: hypothetical protein NC418_11895 [Muribaculaceae bacterium]|nr:hypothetical protein [Muribaculaceae bacterium]
MEEEKIEKTQPEEPAATPARSKGAVAWTALALAFAAWLILIFGNGFVALPFGIAAIGIAIWGIAACRGGLRKLSITALIAATVLAVVVGGFILALNLLQ